MSTAMLQRMKSDILTNYSQLLTVLINVYRQCEINRALLKAFFVILDKVSCNSNTKECPCILQPAE